MAEASRHPATARGDERTTAFRASAREGRPETGSGAVGPHDLLSGQGKQSYYSLTAHASVVRSRHVDHAGLRCDFNVVLVITSSHIERIGSHTALFSRGGLGLAAHGLRSYGTHHHGFVAWLDRVAPSRPGTRAGQPGRYVGYGGRGLNPVRLGPGSAGSERGAHGRIEKGCEFGFRFVIRHQSSE